MSAEQPTSSDSGSSGIKRFGKYDIQRQLGAGGMGIVYLAVDRELRRTVALKILSKERAKNPILVKRFRAEGQTAAHLQHPGIIHVYESGEIDGLLYLALEYVDGIDLLEWLRKRGVLPVRRSIDIIRQVAEALQHAAEKQIVHRDIKPSNIMIRADGTAKLADMGLARFVDDNDDTSITRAGTTVGTVDYMAPEQAQSSKAADIRSDMYSLGCAWYHMVTGTPPYPEGSVTNKLQAHANGRLPDPRTLNPNVPEGVVAVIHRMMAKRPEDRYQTPAELLVDLNNPAISRGEVAADVFAALAMEGPAETDEDGNNPSPQNSPTGNTSLSIGSAATRADWDANIDFDDEDHNDAPSEPEPQSPRRPTGKPKPAARASRRKGKAAERETPNVLEGSPPPDSTSARSGARQAARGTSEPPSATPAKRSRPTSGATSRGKSETPVSSGTSRKGRAGRSEGAAGNSGPGIAIDFQRLGLRLAAAVLLVGTAWFLLNQIPVWFSSDQGVAANPYATDLTPVITPEPDKAEQPAMMVQEDDAPTDPSVSAQEFPGVDEAGLDKKTITEFLPDWLQSGWGQHGANEPAVTRIAPYGGVPNSVRTLAAALEGLSGQDAILEFVDEGPHQVAPAVFLPPVGSPVRQITLRGAPGQRTTLLVDADNADQRQWLSAEKGTLRLERLDVLVLSRGLPSDRPPFLLLDLKNSDLIAQDCSFTVMTPPDSTESIRGDAVHISGMSAGKNRVLMENCSLHLRELCGINVAANSCDVVLGNCLVDSAAVPTIRLGEPGPETNPLVTHLRRIAMLGCSVVSDGPLLQARQSDASPLPIELRVRRSLMVGRADAGPWIDLQNWPLSTDARLESPAARDITLKCEHVRFINRTRLTLLTAPAGDTTLVEDTTSWRQFWKQPLPTDDWITRNDATFAPQQLVRTTDLSSTFTEELKPGIGARAQLGVDAATIPEVAKDSEERTVTGLTRVRPPEDFGLAPSKGKELRFDLKRANAFQDFLNSPDCPSGTTVVCFGIGLKSLPPVVIKGKKLRIAFEQDQEGAELVIQPASDDNAEAWFRVEQGQLDLINAPLRIPTSRTRKYPQTLLLLQDSEATIQRCRLQGPDEVPAHVALIDVQSTTATRKFVSISDSFLSGHGTLLKTGNAEVECSNSAFCSSGVSVALSDGSTHGDLLFFHCTFSSGAVLDVSRATPTPDHSRNAFLRNCVFLPPPVAGDSATGFTGSTIVLTAAGDASSNCVKWWEANCAYAQKILHWMTADPSDGTATLTTDRRRLLTPSQKFQEVVGPNGVLLTAPLPKRSDLQPENLQLIPQCDAATRSLDGGPLGVRLPIGPDLTPTARPSGAPGKTTTPQKAPPKGPFRPDF